MKTPQNTLKTLGALLLLSNSSTSLARDVDTELLLLVDVSGSVNTTEYNLMMDGYANAFLSPTVVSAIQTGYYQSIAAAVMFWSGRDEQVVGVDWTLINSTETAASFSDAIRQTTRPFSGMTAIGSGIEAGTSFFGTETGGTDNGFNSLVQVIDVSGDGTDNNTPPDGIDRAQNVRTSRDASLAAGVDMINGLPIGNAGGALEDYYIDNVIGGSAGGSSAFTVASSDFSRVEESLTAKLQREVSAAGTESVAIATSVPEPGSLTLLALASGWLVFRRRR